MVVVKTF